LLHRESAGRDSCKQYYRNQSRFHGLNSDAMARAENKGDNKPDGLLAVL
jgi:hypothetical protein